MIQSAYAVGMGYDGTLNRLSRLLKLGFFWQNTPPG
jgi:hypothetical protein